MRKVVIAILSLTLVLVVSFGVRRSKEPQSYPRRDLRVVLGYKDTRPARFVGDLYESGFIASQLQSMGFERDPKDDDVFVWRQSPLEPKRDWTVRLIHSSASPDDEDNRKNPWQKWLSQKSQQEFIEALKGADAVFYVGHSRMGGGPDFEPPKLTKDGHVDYSYYKKTKPGLENLRAGLKAVEDNKLKFIGLYSCSSGQHFEKILKQRAPAVRLETTSDAIYYIDSLQLLMEGIKNQLKPQT